MRIYATSLKLTIHRGANIPGDTCFRQGVSRGTCIGSVTTDQPAGRSGGALIAEDIHQLEGGWSWAQNVIHRAG